MARDAIRLLLTARTCRRDRIGNAALALSMHAPPEVERSPGSALLLQPENFGSECAANGQR